MTDKENDEKKDSSEPPVAIEDLSYNDAIEFLAAAKAELPCPACGCTTWGVTTSTSIEDGVAGPVIPMSRARSSKLVAHIPVMMVACMRCSYLRFHSKKKIIEWVAQGKKEIN